MLHMSFEVKRWTGRVNRMPLKSMPRGTYVGLLSEKEETTERDVEICGAGNGGSRVALRARS